MRQVFSLVILVLVGQLLYAQSNYIPYQSRNKWIAGKFDSTFHIPSGTTPSLRTGGYDYRGALFYKTSDSAVYVYTGTQWIKVSSASTDYIDSLRRSGVSVQARKNGSWVTQFSDSIGVTTVGTYNSATPSANGAVISGNTITFQTFGAEVPGMVPAEADSNKVLHGDGVWRTASGGVNARDTLTGASPSWDFSTANFAMLSVTTAATVSVTNSNDMDAGVLRIIGNGTDSVILSGTAEDSLTISTCDSCITDVAFLNHGGSIYWTLVGKYAHTTSGGSATEGYMTYTSTTDLTESSAHVFTSPGGGSSFGNLGLDTVSFAANQSGRIWHKYTGSTSQNCVFGFNTVNAQTGYAGMEAAVYFGTSNDWSKVDGGTPSSVGGAVTPTIYVGLYRDGSTGAIKLQYSSDEVSWTDKATLTYNTTAQLYFVCDISGSATLDTPKWKKL